MIRKIVQFSLEKKFLTLFIVLVMIFVGAVSFKRLPIEAYPDIADTWVQIITQWPGHAAEEMERQVTVPMEIAMSSVPHHTDIRSVSLFGLSVVTLIFDEQIPVAAARGLVYQQMDHAPMPSPGIQPALGPMSSPVGQFYWFYLDSKTRNPMELKEIEDWDLEKRLREVPGVADISSFGGLVKQYQALVSPVALANYGVSTAAIVTALSNNNQNAGGGFIYHGDQTFNIRGVGKADTVTDLGNVIITQKNGTPIRVKNVGQVVIGPQQRLGNISVSERRPDGSIDSRDDVVEGIIVPRVGEPDETVLKLIEKKVKELNTTFLPPDVKIKPYLDRTDLIHITTSTVEENMVTGMLLVFIILFFFLGNLRSALIVASVIPLSLMFASILLDLQKIPANLLSLGALDFGMVIDGAVVMVENIFRHKQLRKQQADADQSMMSIIKEAASEVERPIVYAIAIIILAYLPIFTLQRVEGRLFMPMAWTVAFALLGALFLALTVVPVLCLMFLDGDLKEWHNPFMHWLEVKYRHYLGLALENRKFVIQVAIGSFIVALILTFSGAIGSEFIPHLDEGSLWVRGTLPPSASYDLAAQTVKKAREVYMQFPEIPIAVCQLGRPDDGTDATGFFNTECFVDLIPRKKWRKEFRVKEDLIAAVNKELLKIPGVIWNFSQPISDNVEEMLSGVKGALVVKIYGEDLKILEQKAEEVKKTIAQVRGIEDLGVFDEMGQPNVNITINRDKISRYGLNISDVQDVIETAVGGKAASQIMDGEKRFDVIVRYQPQYRDSVESIKNILVATPDGYRMPLEELADIRIDDGASTIYREKGSRYIAIKFSVRGRDLGSTIEEAQKVVKKSILMPEGYHMNWTGEFESQRRAEARLAIVIPLTVFAIFFVLFLVFGSVKWALIIMANVVLARIGGVLALFLTGTNFSVSSGIGFLAVFGVSIQTGVLLVSYINQMRLNGHSVRNAVIEGSVLRLRPIMMTALVATFGLLPAALSHAIGSDSQRPMAIVIVGGLLCDLIMAFFLLPTLYIWFAKPNDKLLS